MINPNDIIMHFDEFLAGAVPSDISLNLTEKEKEELYDKHVEIQHRQDVEWSMLANQVVGAEVFIW